MKHNLNSATLRFSMNRENQPLSNKTSDRSFIYQSFNTSIFLLLFFFPFRTPAVKTHRVEIMQLVSLVSQSRDIDAYALLDSKENIAKKVNCRMC